jgi:hypothetical protein
MIKITKTIARKLWGKKDIVLCPSNLRPGLPFRPDMTVFAADIEKALASEYDHEKDAAAFDAYVRNFEWYNCEDNETGKHASFYLID